MDISEYLSTVRKQLTTPGIRDAIEQELGAHLEDQKTALMEEGMEEQEAEEAAVTEMGDPVETGLALNEIHRVKPSGKYIYPFLFLNLFTAALNVWEIMNNKNMSTVTGISAMVIFFLIPVFAVYFCFIYMKFETQELGKIFLLSGNLGLMFSCQAVLHNIYGRGAVFQDPYFFHGTLLMFLGYLGILFHYRRQDRGWWKCQILGLCILAVTVFTTWDVLFIAEASVMYAVLYTSIYDRGWFPGAGKRILAGVWAPALIAFAGIAYNCLSDWPGSLSIDFGKLARTASGGINTIDNASDFSFLPRICEKFGLAPVYFLLLVGMLFLGLLVLYRHRITNEWGKMVFLACILILAAMLFNGMLAAMGKLSGEMAFAPFMWRFTLDYDMEFADFSQCVIFYLMASYLTRFTVRDTVTALEIENQRIRAKKTQQTAKNP